MQVRRKPGQVRDAILNCLQSKPDGATPAEIKRIVAAQFREQVVAASSVRSYLALNTPGSFERTPSGRYRLRGLHRSTQRKSTPTLFTEACVGRATVILGDCLHWLANAPSHSVHGVVTDPPYGLVEYSASEQQKLRAGRGGVWRIPPSFDGHQRSPVPRFTTLDHADICSLVDFFYSFGQALLPVLVPGAHILLASNPLVSYTVAAAMVDAGFERRGEVVRLVMTLRGGDRPKNAHNEFPEVSAMPRSMWEPWLLFRKPLDGRVQDNLRRWKTGGLRRPERDKPFGDVIRAGTATRAERRVAAHPTLKPQEFLRPVVRAILPLGEGVVLDPFAGSGSTLAAAEWAGYRSIGIESDPRYFRVAQSAIEPLSRLIHD